MNEIEILKEENEKLKKINGVKSDLISISAHQLRTSLSALKWILQMFIDKDLGILTAEQQEYMQKAIDSNSRMMVLVNDLLTLNHAEDTTIKFNLVETDIVDLLEQTVCEFKGETEKKGITLTFHRHNEPIPKVTCDPAMARVVFQNMVENAIKYSRPADTVTVTLTHNAEANTVEIAVHDTGIGIKSADQGQIFDKFFRAENAIAKDYIGSGLGLFTTKNIVERHKGKIWFESSEGTGTTFFVTLPIS